MSASTSLIRRAAAAFIAGSAGTALSGVIVQLAVLPTTDVSDDRWSYPWSSGAFVAVTLFYAVLHALLAVGLVGFDRSGAAGQTRPARVGVGLAIAGTAVLVAAELASIPISGAAMSDTGAQLVGAMFGLGTLLSGIGLLIAGTTTLRAGVWRGWRRLTPLITGVWTTVLVGLATTSALPGAVAVYGACLLAMAVALHTQPAPAAATAAALRPEPV